MKYTISFTILQAWPCGRRLLPEYVPWRLVCRDQEGPWAVLL